MNWISTLVALTISIFFGQNEMRCYFLVVSKFQHEIHSFIYKSVISFYVHVNTYAPTIFSPSPISFHLLHGIFVSFFAYHFFRVIVVLLFCILRSHRPKKPYIENIYSSLGSINNTTQYSVIVIVIVVSHT